MAKHGIQGRGATREHSQAASGGGSPIRMTKTSHQRETSEELPAVPADRLTGPLTSFLHLESVGGGLLLLATVVAIGLFQSPWAHDYASLWETPLGVRVASIDFTRSFREWINDGLMTLFFFVVALELKRELVLGEMRSPRKAAFSVAAALGGMAVPAALYLALMGGGEGTRGFGTVMATDTAFVIGCLALLGRRVPQNLRVFMLSLAIVDDIGAILVVAIGYSSDISWWPLAGGALGLVCVRGMSLAGIRSVPLYILVGVACWVAIDASGLHPTIAGVCLGLLTPTRAWVTESRLRTILAHVAPPPTGDSRVDEAELRATWRIAETAIRESLSPVERLEMALHPWVSIAIMPLFALANAGVALTGADLTSPITLAIIVGLSIGKPAGVTLFAWLAVRTGAATRPTDVSWRMLAGGGLLAGIGFTMALFIAELAFSETNVAPAKLGILAASVLSALAGLAVLAWPVRARPPLPAA